MTYHGILEPNPVRNLVDCRNPMTYRGKEQQHQGTCKLRCDALVPRGLLALLVQTRSR